MHGTHVDRKMLSRAMQKIRSRTSHEGGKLSPDVEYAWRTVASLASLIRIQNAPQSMVKVVRRALKKASPDAALGTPEEIAAALETIGDTMLKADMPDEHRPMVKDFLEYMSSCCAEPASR